MKIFEVYYPHQNYDIILKKYLVEQKKRKYILEFQKEANLQGMSPSTINK